LALILLPEKNLRLASNNHDIKANEHKVHGGALHLLLLIPFVLNYCCLSCLALPITNTIQG
jgi:hypothetical protein